MTERQGVPNVHRSTSMLTGAHVLISSTKAAADRAFLRDVLELPSVDAGEGWLIFGLPPAEVAIHPSHKNGAHEIYLMVADVRAFVAAMRRRRVRCGAIRDRGWGLVTEILLPGGGRLGVYQPRHARPKSMTVRRPTHSRPRTGRVRLLTRR